MFPTCLAAPLSSSIASVLLTWGMARPLHLQISSIWLGSEPSCLNTSDSISLAARNSLISSCSAAMVKFSSSRMSAQLRTNLAPSWIRRLVPLLAAERMLPGIAKTSRFCSSAWLAVIKAPLLSPASITSTPRLNPLISLLRHGKFSALGLVPKGYSLIRAPRSMIAWASLAFSAG